MKKRGQALVEFVIIIPIFFMLVLGIIDMGRILYSKIILEEQISDVISLYEKGKSIQEIQNELKDPYEIAIDYDEEYVNFSLEKQLDILTPGLNFVLDNPYTIQVTRSILNE